MQPDVADALCICLSLAGNAGQVEAAAARVGWPAIVGAAATLRLGPALVARLRDRGAVPAIPPVVLASGMRTVTASFDEIWQAHVERRTAFIERLVELTAALNAQGLEPVLMKGARSLASGAPAWRSMRDIDLLLIGDSAARAHATAISLGYAAATEAREKAGKHHFQPLFRDDLPGWLEVHRRAATFRAESLLPTELLETMTLPATIGPAKGRILDAPAHALHAVIHHHVGHRGDKGGGIDLKGLFEFAADVTAMTGDERARAVKLAARHPRVLAALDLWIAAAHAAFGMRVEAPFALHADAVERAVRALGRAAIPEGRYAGVFEEIGFANRRQRLERLPGGSDLFGRQRLRLATITSMLRPMIDPTGD